MVFCTLLKTQSGKKFAPYRNKKSDVLRFYFSLTLEPLVVLMHMSIGNYPEHQSRNFVLSSESLKTSTVHVILMINAGLSSFS